MSKYIEDAEGNFIADSNRGTITYADAVRTIIDRYRVAFEQLTYNLVDDIQYLAVEETHDPSEGVSPHG